MLILISSDVLLLSSSEYLNLISSTKFGWIFGQSRYLIVWLLTPGKKSISGSQVPNQDLNKRVSSNVCVEISLITNVG